MTDNAELKRLALSLNDQQRIIKIMSLSEEDLTINLKALLNEINPNSYIEITHGKDEFGKDIVIKDETPYGKELTALVIKTGNIGARAMGMVHVITEQVQECFDHPASLKGIFENLPVNKVLVVFSGYATGNAKIRLYAGLKKISNAIKVLDIDWLVKNFTEYYPQIFFEGVVIDHINNQILKWEQSISLPKYHGNLSDTWVDPLVADLNKEIELNADTITVVFEQKRLPFSQLKTVLQTYNKIILSGDPGTGKSTALKKLGLDMLKQAFNSLVKGSLKTVLMHRSVTSWYNS